MNANNEVTRFPYIRYVHTIYVTVQQRILLAHLVNCVATHDTPKCYWTVITASLKL